MNCEITILKRQPLYYGFSEITLATSSHASALPGQYVLLEHIPTYIMWATSEALSFIVADEIANKEIIKMGPLQGEGLPAPNKVDFNLLIAQDALNATLFYLKKYRTHFTGLVFIGSDSLFPFKACPSRLLIEDIPPDVIAALPLLEDWGIPHRLANAHFIPGCYEGNAEDLARQWEKQNPSSIINKIILHSL